MIKGCARLWSYGEIGGSETNGSWAQPMDQVLIVHVMIIGVALDGA